SGGDSITGGSNNDTLSGAGGNDTYFFWDGWGDDTLGTPDGGTNDTIDFTNLSAVTISSNATNVITGSDGSSLTFSGDAPEHLNYNPDPGDYRSSIVAALTKVRDFVAGVEDAAHELTNALPLVDSSPAQLTGILESFQSLVSQVTAAISTSMSLDDFVSDLN